MPNTPNTDDYTSLQRRVGYDVGMPMAFRYAVSALMAVFGLAIIYYEFVIHRRLEGIALGSLLIVWAFTRLWVIKRYIEPRRRV
jgi:hypothetical protein